METRLENLGISGALRVETFLVVVVHWRAWMNRKILAKWKKRFKRKDVGKGNGKVPKTNLSYFRTAPWQALYPGEGKKTFNSFSSLLLVTGKTLG